MLHDFAGSSYAKWVATPASRGTCYGLRVYVYSPPKWHLSWTRSPVHAVISLLKARDPLYDMCLSNGSGCSYATLSTHSIEHSAEYFLLHRLLSQCTRAVHHNESDLMVVPFLSSMWRWSVPLTHSLNRSTQMWWRALNLQHFNQHTAHKHVFFDTSNNHFLQLHKHKTLGNAVFKSIVVTYGRRFSKHTHPHEAQFMYENELVLPRRVVSPRRNHERVKIVTFHSCEAFRNLSCRVVRRTDQLWPSSTFCVVQEGALGTLHALFYKSLAHPCIVVLVEDHVRNESTYVPSPSRRRFYTLLPMFKTHWKHKVIIKHSLQEAVEFVSLRAPSHVPPNSAFRRALLYDLRAGNDASQEALRELAHIASTYETNNRKQKRIAHQAKHDKQLYVCLKLRHKLSLYTNAHHNALKCRVHTA